MKNVSGIQQRFICHNVVCELAEQDSLPSSGELDVRELGRCFAARRMTLITSFPAILRFVCAKQFGQKKNKTFDTLLRKVCCLNDIMIIMISSHSFNRHCAPYWNIFFSFWRLSPEVPLLGCSRGVRTICYWGSFVSVFTSVNY